MRNTHIKLWQMLRRKSEAIKLNMKHEAVGFTYIMY